MASLLLAPEGCVLHLDELLRLLDSSVAAPLMRYLDELEVFVQKASANPAIRWQTPSQDRSQLALHVGAVLSTWPSKHASLRRCSVALWSALMTKGQLHLKQRGEVRRVDKARSSIQDLQEQTCLQIAQDLQKAVGGFSSQMQHSVDSELMDMASSAHVSLMRIQELSTEVLERQKRSWMDVMQDYLELESEAESCNDTLRDTRLQVQNHVQELSEEVQSFAVAAHHVVEWKKLLLPQLRLVETHRAEFKQAMELRLQLQILQKEHIVAEDSFDNAQIELRKYTRHARMTQPEGLSLNGFTLSSVDSTTLEENYYEQRVAEACEQAQSFARQVQQAQTTLQEIEAALPLAVESDEQASLSDRCTSMWPEGQWVLKLVQMQAERDEALRLVAAGINVESEVMCPIMHERMQEPVLAADGHTYERGAIEKWMAAHNTSPMTGAPLMHRFLTQNFALKRIISSCGARSNNCESGDSPASTGMMATTLAEQEDEEHVGEEGLRDE